MYRVLSIVVIIVSLAACQKEQFYSGKTSLSISADTIWFDTLFTKAPGTKYPISVTKIFSVKNKEKGTVKVNFRLGGGASSPYRINVDGFSGTDIKDVEIPAKDSVFVFVQCALEANNLTMPALVLDSLLTTVNGTEQKTFLAAYGWDAHYYQSLVLPCNEVWADKVKPYVIIDNALVKSGCTFTIKQGVTVYNSARSTLLVQGTLKIEGTVEEPVKFTGDKAGYQARLLPNQWGGIYLMVGSTGNEIKNARIHNAAIGVRVDSLPVSGAYNLRLENTSIMYCGQACLAGITANIEATNCIFAQPGSYTFLGLLGGTYLFRHCTFAGYGSFSTRQDGSFAITNTIRDGNGIILKTAPMSCTVLNSIIYGSKTEEFLIDSKGSAAFAATFTNNIIASKSQPYSGNTYNKDPLFKSTSSADFALGDGSPAIDKGSPLLPSIPEDFNGKLRDINPDLGAIEK